VALPAAVIFDNDGLLLDTESVWTRGEEELFARRGREFTLSHKQELIGTSAPIAGRLLAGHLGEPDRELELIAELDEIVFAELGRGVEPMPGALELVAMLRDLGVPTAVVSNSPTRFIARALSLVGASDLFHAIVSGHEVPAPKPAPDAYLEAARLLGLAAGPEVIVLEDSPTGVAAGRAAGMTVIGVPSLPGVELDEAHDVVESLREPRLLERLGIRTRFA
jgi:HAD superfamily hydrolase (TIGR01509 family)